MFLSSFENTAKKSPFLQQKNTGLVQFIADLRNARARELEEKRINKELANIRFAATFVLTRIKPCYELVADQPQGRSSKAGSLTKKKSSFLTTGLG